LNVRTIFVFSAAERGNRGLDGGRKQSDAYCSLCEPVNRLRPIRRLTSRGWRPWWLTAASKFKRRYPKCRSEIRCGTLACRTLGALQRQWLRVESGAHPGVEHSRPSWDTVWALRLAGRPRLGLRSSCWPL